MLFPNKKINLNYFIEDKYEAGIELKGTEVKSIIKANANIDEAFVIIRNQEAYVINMYVAPFKEGNINNVDPNRNRKLLLHKNEIIKMDYQVKKNRLTIIPTKVYLQNGMIKMEVSIFKSNKAPDK
ncbi:MAG: SsrA-binding protein SmpB, partial [Mycoplasmoidaceae bacterium]|nr:SsrA-binding protein SmpB [Mycoplasmoidaceae bacterium]